MRVREALAAATARLAATSDTARLDAELLMAHALGVDREALLLERSETAAPPSFEMLVQRRLKREPVAYVTGRRAFWTIELEVGPGALVPRPDSETLIEAAVAHFGARGPAWMLDLGTGPGTLLLAGLAQWPAARGIGIDASEVALGYARRNAERLGLAGRSEWRHGDWAAGVAERFDLILCNPPYVEAEALLPPDVARWEPEEALYAGWDGLADYRRLAPQLGPLLAPGGIACLELGAGQLAAASALFAGQGFTIESRADLSGTPRALILSLDRG
ncbi:MAG: peptide chain release factor N(5)-glutamine methyltransferase [Sphingomonas sp.]